MSLAMADLTRPLLIAVLIGWILTVVLHEFAHGIVAHWGGDYTIAEKGGLSLNPLQYIHPVYSLLMPAIFLLMGGVPLVGGATYVRKDLLRSRVWQSATSAAGPAMNLLLFLIGLIAMHPKVGWVDDSIQVSDWPRGQLVVATLMLLQIYAIFLNLLPVPPLDGFGIISPYLNRGFVEKVTQPAIRSILLILTFILVTSRLPNGDSVQGRLMVRVEKSLELAGYDDLRIIHVEEAYNLALFGKDR